MKFKPRPYQANAAQKAVEFLTSKTEKGNGLIVAPTGCHAKGYEILMADGTLKKVEDIRTGDRLMGTDGYRTVLQLRRGTDDMYRITPNKGVPFTVNGGHILALYKTNEGYSKKGVAFEHISVTDYIRKNKTYKHLHKLYKRNICTFEGEKENLALPPYLVGLLIGDGSMCNGNVNITTMREEVREYIYGYAKENGLAVREYRKEGSKASTYNIHKGKETKGRNNPLIGKLREAGLYGKRAKDKFIPHDYKTSTIENRLELLAGLFDTDTFYDTEKNIVEYSTKSLQLAYDVEFLCRSLGLSAYRGKVKVINGEEYQRIQISGDLSAIPARVEIRKGRERRQKKSTQVVGFSVEHTGKGEYYGFTLDGDHVYFDWQFIAHHNCGKSVIIAEIANQLNENVLVFCPSKEITMQNYSKMKNYTDDCSMWSASVGEKKLSKITFAMIGSVKNNKEKFNIFKYVLIDEAHGINPESGMYKDFLEYMPRRVVGLTATPYRLVTTGQTYLWKEKRMDLSNAVSKLLPIVGKDQIFSKVLCNIDTEYLLEQGFLAHLRYYDVRRQDMKGLKLFPNSAGTEYSESSLKWMEEHTDFYNYTIEMILRMQHPKSGIKRNGILVFVRMVEIAEMMATHIPSCRVVSGKTPAKERDQTLKDFADGKFEVLLNVSCLTTGYDRPDLDTVVLCTPTMSLARYYQIAGRALRPFEGKDGWIIDFGGNIERFGEVHRLKFRQDELGQWNVYNDRRRLTNVKL